jgi:hypothetical protein
MSLGSPLAAFVDKPSDGLMLFVLAGCTLFFLWVSMKVSYEAARGRGCSFLVKGCLVVVLLLLLGLVLVSSFQALHPGQ